MYVARCGLCDDGITADSHKNESRLYCHHRACLVTSAAQQLAERCRLFRYFLSVIHFSSLLICCILFSYFLLFFSEKKLEFLTSHNFSELCTDFHELWERGYSGFIISKNTDASICAFARNLGLGCFCERVFLDAELLLPVVWYLVYLKDSQLGGLGSVVE